MIGRVGDDPLAKVALRSLRETGVDLRHVGRAHDSPTGVAMIMVYPNGDKGIVIAANANDAWGDADIEAAVSAVKHPRVRTLWQTWR